MAAWRGLCVCMLVLAAACSAGGGRAGADQTDDRPSTTAGHGQKTAAVGSRLVEDPGLAAEIPTIEGVRFAKAEPPTHGDMLHLPPRSHLVRRGIEVGGAPMGFITVVDAPDRMDHDTFEDTVVDGFFAGPVDVWRGEVRTGKGVLVTSNPAAPHWSTYGNEFVMEAVVDQDQSGRWEWFWDDLLWIVESAGISPSLLDQLIRSQHEISPPDNYDTAVIAGELAHHFADLPHYTYIDLPRAALTKNLKDSVAGTCADQWLPFGVAKDPDDVAIDADNLLVEMAVVGARCDTFAEDFRAVLMDAPGAHNEAISGQPTVAGDRMIGWLEDGVAYVISAEGPGGLADYRPFIEAFIKFQADLPADD